MRSRFDAARTQSPNIIEPADAGPVLVGVHLGELQSEARRRSPRSPKSASPVRASAAAHTASTVSSVVLDSP